MAALKPLAAAVALSAGLADAAPFTLQTPQGQSWSLSSVLGRERILIVSNPPAAYLAEVRRQDTDLQVRDLRVVALLPPGDARLNGPQSLMLTLLADPGGKVGAQYGRAALIGKDTGIKARYQTFPVLNTVAALIDTMPMRRQERRERGR
ncbi:DUF4174 domain-containing protein [Deinococcus humi]|uniref:DUF4174 domain-containing protein n=1 Tax=Deinococcus humi TaxID=662880 RepID=A0A7W8JUA1_9DEIO|nr:DUF4174 domain-containing protein [Deinococcus humi]MBB5363289.1 hypothetical protein [Deinococcus humi]GGO27277.1 hypothetical protein GCM10008949_18790 [Deinococcus humi]